MSGHRPWSEIRAAVGAPLTAAEEAAIREAIAERHAKGQPRAGDALAHRIFMTLDRARAFRSITAWCRYCGSTRLDEHKSGCEWVALRDADGPSNAPDALEAFRLRAAACADMPALAPYQALVDDLIDALAQRGAA